MSKFKQLPRRMIQLDNCRTIFLPSFTDEDRVISMLESNAISIFNVEVGGEKPWISQRLNEYLAEPRLLQIVVFGDLSDSDLIATTLVALDKGFKVFAVVSRPDLRNPHNLFVWMRLRDQLVTTFSTKLFLAELDFLK